MIATLRHPKQSDPDPIFLGNALARYWLAGGEVDWTGYWAEEKRRRVALPTYPFDRRRYWVDPLPDAKRAERRKAGRKSDPAEWFYAPVWRQSRLPISQVSPALPANVSEAAAAVAAESWLVFLDRAGLGETLAERLEAGGRSVVRVVEGEGFGRGVGVFTVTPGRRTDYDALLDALGRVPSHVLHLWNVTADGADAGGADPDWALDRGFYSLVFLAQALGRKSAAETTAITVVASGLAQVTGEEPLEPLKATLLGPVTVLPRELPNLSCRSLDVALGKGGRAALERAVSQILAEIERPAALSTLPTVAFRGGLRFVRDFEPLPLPESAMPALRQGGICLITGGMGGIGLTIAEHLAHESKARLVLVGRSPVSGEKRERLRAIEAAGGEVLALSADVTDLEAMRQVVAAAEAHFGDRIHGVVHAAGVAGGGLLSGKTRESAERVLAPKVRGALVLAELFAGIDLDLFALTSSITVLLPQVGQADYVSANAFLDAFATLRAREGEAATSINWDAWRETGMAVSTAVPEELRAWREQSLAQGLASAEGVEAFRRVVAASGIGGGSGLPQVVVSTLDLATRLAENERLVPLAALEEVAPAAAAHPRPGLATAYVPAESELEKSVAAVWQEILGVEPVGLHDNFFELGGNSLAGLRLVQRLRERLGASLSEVSLYEAPTVATLARLVGGEAGPAAGAAGSAAPAEQESRARGERRKARLAGKRGAGR